MMKEFMKRIKALEEVEEVPEEVITALHSAYCHLHNFPGALIHIKEGKEIKAFKTVEDIRNLVVDAYGELTELKKWINNLDKAFAIMRRRYYVSDNDLPESH